MQCIVTDIHVYVSPSQTLTMTAPADTLAIYAINDHLKPLDVRVPLQLAPYETKVVLVGKVKPISEKPRSIS
jgi:hypothetical protein